MLIVTSQDGMSAGVLGVNSIMQVVQLPVFEEGETPDHSLLVNGIPFGRFKASETAVAVIKKVKTDLAIMLREGESFGVEHLFQVPADES